MSEQRKWTPGWILTLRQSWPFGIEIRDEVGEMVLQQDGAAFSPDQKTFQDWVDGVGFDPRAKSPVFSREEAVAAVARQIANATLIQAAPELYEELEKAHEIISALSKALIRLAPIDDPVMVVDIRLEERRAALAKADGE